MRPSLEQIVDYARGIASPDVALLVESDAQALKLVDTFRAVQNLDQEAVPENWLDRAKSIFVPEGKKSSILKGILAFHRMGLQAGFRSVQSSVLVAACEFETATLEVRAEPKPEKNQVLLVGIFDANMPGQIHVQTEEGNETLCDEDGQFTISIARTERILRFENREANQQFEVTLQYET